VSSPGGSLRRNSGGPGTFLLRGFAVALILALSSIAATTPVSAQLSDATQRLFRAVEVNDMSEVRSAMAAGADITAKNPAGKTAADIAVDKGHFIIAHFLLSERRSSKTAKTESDRKPVRLKPVPKPPRKAVAKARPRPTAPTAEAKARPGVRKSIDLPPANPIRLAKRKKSERFQLAPRKPTPPSQPVAEITDEVAVATAPGVDKPDGRDPLRTGALRPPDGEDAEEVAVENGTEPGGTEKKSLGAVGDFFQSLVDLVTPSDEVRPPKRTPAVPPPPLETAVAERPQSKDGDRDAAMPETDIPADDEDGPDEMAALDEETLEDGDLPAAADDGPPLSDDGIEMTIEEPEVDGLPDEVVEDGPLEETVLEDADREDFPGGEADTSTTSRTLDRLRGLISDEEPEDENGLPVVALPEPGDLPPVIGRRDEAAESVLRELAEQERGRTELPRGEFLDDPPTGTDEPTEIWRRSIAPLAKPRQDNPTVSWRNRDPETNAVSILEVRQYDDTRGGFPDTQRGAVMLYYANSPTIFPQVSAHELMRLKRIAAATPQDQPGEGEDGGSGQVVDETPTGPEVAPDELFGEDEQDGFPPPDDEPIEGAPDVRLEDLPSDLTDDGPAADEVIEGLPGDGENGIGGEVIEGLPENGDVFPELPPGNS